ncbi:AAA family ATPase [Microbacterium sp. 179-I 3D3 NHS]|uniref:AAA family ATPase n=1 Tax=Microbacterium sp. 179-I 3D3 NHS TaxID=3142382 RepID=UPI00399F17ED
MWELRPERSRAFAEAITDARAGRPRVVCIDGDSGMGKSAHLRRLRAAADGFRVLEAYGDPAAYRPPFGVLQQLGVTRTAADDGTLLSPAVAAQALRRVIDEKSRDDALLIAVDDAHWADEESMDALRLVLERTAGDRLLVAVASRPLTGSEHLPWRGLRDRLDGVAVVRLDGIALAEAAQIVGSSSPTADARTVERLWRHTDGNPMYLRSLLGQYSWEDLRDADELPAPVEVARDLDARLSAFDADAAALLRAIAIVGPSWVDRLDAAAIAEIDDAATAVEILLSSGLLVARSGGALTDVRIVHALVRAAIHQSIPADERRRGHLRAAAVLNSPMRRLEHEVAGARRRDEALARRLEDAALAARASTDHRREAQLLQWASQLSEDVAERERRWLDSQLATVLARDVRSVRDRLSEIAWAGDIPRRTVVMAMLFLTESRIADARHLLEGVSDADLSAADELTRTRILVLTAWTMLVSGAPTDRVAAIIRHLPATAAQDVATASFYIRTAGQVAGRQDDFDHLSDDLAAVPLTVQDTPMEDTSRLGWRGAIYSLCGFAREARRDLAEVVSRVRSGRVGGTGGVDHVLYGFALWQDGEIDRAGIEFDAATALALDRLPPLVQAALPLVPLVRGDLERADRLLEESETVLRDLPWTEAIAMLMMAQVARRHAGDDEAARSGYLDYVRTLFGADVASASHPSGAIWHLHVALARIWAGEGDQVEDHLIAIERDMIVPEWAGWARPWLVGLAAERDGDDATALRQLRDAADRADDELPLYRAHLHADLARVASRAGDDATAGDASGRARDLYARIGATRYVERMSAGGRSTDAAAGADVFAALSDREREVATLLIAGFSYAQIAAELFVTRSTVGFHLGNIYAKTGVSTRHALTRLARS